MVSTLLLALVVSPNLDAEIRTLQSAAGDNYAYRLVEDLTTEVGPRLAGSEAEARARAWAVSKLKALGFAGVRVEPVAVHGWQRGTEQAEIIDPFPQRLAISALGGSVTTPKAGITAELAAFESLVDLQQADASTVRGKIVFINQATPKTQDGAGYGATVAIRRDGPSAAAKMGALAILIRSVGTDQHRFPHTGMLKYADDLPKIPAAAVSAPDADQLSRITARGHRPTIRLQLLTQHTGEKTSGNVIAEIPGRTHPNEIILAGAHLDSWDLGTGAVDDGAGVAIVTAAAKLILDHAPRAPARTIRVVLFGAEEIGLVGAFAYAKAHRQELARHVVALESDLGAGPVFSISGRVNEDTWGAIKNLQRHHLSRLRIIIGQKDRFQGPDLYPLVTHNVPIVSLNQDGRDYFDLHHTADDTLDKIDAHGLKQNVAAYASVLWWASETGGSWPTPSSAP